VLGNSVQTRRDSVLILPKSKDKIRSYVHGLRECIENANMTEAKRSALLKRLDELEKELEKRRNNKLFVAKLAFEVLAIPGGTWASYEIAAKLVANISLAVGESREAEQASKSLVAVQPVPALSAPRKPLPRATGGFSDDLDDDVPF
jgi:vacuolar-type H+-ATPase subunit I/STV1